MANNVTVSNSPTSDNPDIPVRTTQTSDNKHIQHLRIDIGSGSAESVISASNPLPVAGTFSVDPAGLATDANQATEISYLTSIDSHIIKANTDSVKLASQANPFTTAIPISDNAGSITVDGTVAATQSGTWNIADVTGTISLPSGAATESTLSTLNGKIPSSLTVTSTRLLVDNSGVTQPISASSLPLPTGAATSAKQPALGTAGTPSSDVITVQGAASMTALKVDGSGATQPVSGTVTANAGTGTFAVSAASLPLPTGAATETTLSTLNGKVTACNTGAVTISSALPAGTNNIGDVDVLTLPSVVAATYSSSSVTSVTAAATSTAILASNANRRMAIFVNDCNKIAYVKLGATASTTSYSYRLTPYQTLELAIPLYTGAIDAIWESSPTGAMRVTEIS